MVFEDLVLVVSVRATNAQSHLVSGYESLFLAFILCLATAFNLF